MESFDCEEEQELQQRILHSNLSKIYNSYKEVIFSWLEAVFFRYGDTLKKIVHHFGSILLLRGLKYSQTILY